jgi:hypothetical protein
VGIDHKAVELELTMPDLEDGGDDAWLLFDMDDPWNGKFAGIVDAGRSFVIGLLEGGVPRVLASAEAPPADPEHPHRLIRVEYLPGVAVGRLDGHPLVFLHLGSQLTEGFFGAETHGKMTVERLGVFEDWEVHKVAFRSAPAVPLSAGVHVLQVEVPIGGAALDQVTIREEGR